MSSADKRTWARFTTNFADSPKVAALSAEAFRTLVEMILWARQELTDGVLPQYIVHRRWNAECIAELLHNHRDRPSLTRNEEGDYVIRDFLEHQESREQVESRKARKSAAARKRWEKKRAPEDASSNAGCITGSSANNYAEEEEEEEIEVLRTSIPPVIPPSTSTARGSRLPEGWEPSEDLVAWTRTNAPAAATNTEVERFRDYWTAQPGARGRKVSWDATWRNWARRCQDDATQRSGYRSQTQVMADIRAQAAEATRRMGATSAAALIEASAS